MNIDEQEYKDGFDSGTKVCSLSLDLNLTDLYLITCPRNWSEAKENGFYDALTEYRKSLTFKEPTL